MNVIIIIVKKNPLTEIYRKGSVKQLKKKQENDAAKETSCPYVTKKKDTHTIKGFLTVQPSSVNSIKT